jgi:hypothetical protein
MKSLVLRIIVIELCSPGGFPLKEASEHFFLYIKGIILVLWFHIICCSAIIFAIFLYSNPISVLFSALFIFSTNIIDLVPYTTHGRIILVHVSSNQIF